MPQARAAPPRPPGKVTAPVLVVAGEASGDAFAAGVVRRLGIPVLAMGGSRLRRAGAEVLVSDRALAAMGPLDALGRASRLGRAFLRVLEAVERQRPKVALLVGFSAFNSRLGRRLRQRGVRVLWYAPPQVWAWRSGRARRLRASCDHVALLLPFEEPLWRSAGVPASYVGHPALEQRHAPRSALRRELGWSEDETAVALLPGSRSGELRRLLGPMLTAAARLARTRPLRTAVLLCDALPVAERRWARRLAEQAGVSVARECRTLPAFDAAFAASGTVTLECALLGVTPIIVYRVDRLTGWAARCFLETEQVGLPNVILRRPAFPELLQSDVNGASLCRSMQTLLARPQHFSDECRRVRQAMALPGSHSPSESVAHLLETWLE